MFCIKCGNPAKIDNFCAEHFLETQTLFATKGFTYIYCSLCGLDEKDLLDKIRQSLKSEHIITSTIRLKTVGNKVHAVITAEGKIKGLKKSEAHELLVILRQKMCDMHVKLSGGYYEAMIQVRGPYKDAIMRELEKLVPKKSITGIQEIKEGYNVKIMRKSNARSAAQVLGEEFSVKRSYKVGGSKKGKMVYRDYYAVR